MKNALSQYRGTVIDGRIVPSCAQCGAVLHVERRRVEDIPWGADMHEAIITRRDIMGLPEDKQSLIMVRENCVLVHPGMYWRKCHEKAQYDKTNSIMHLIRFESLPAILQWLDSIEGEFKTNLVKERRRQVEMVVKRFFS